MDAMVKKNSGPPVLALVQAKGDAPENAGGNGSSASGFVDSGNGLFSIPSPSSGSTGQPALRDYRPTSEENARLLRVIDKASRIKSHHDLFRLLQGEVQSLVSHKIMVSAWGDFHGSDLTVDVVSAVRGVRTGNLNGCGVQRLLKELYACWIANGQRPLLLDQVACDPATHYACNDCALRAAMRSMRSVLVHGIRDVRDGIDSLYLALSPTPITNGYNSDQFLCLVDSIIAQIDVAFRRVAALKSGRTLDGGNSSPNSGELSTREREIMKWLAQGRTNVEIAVTFAISPYTVKNHVQRILRKLNATNRTEAVAKYRYQSLEARSARIAEDNA